MAYYRVNEARIAVIDRSHEFLLAFLKQQMSRKFVSSLYFYSSNNLMILSLVLRDSNRDMPRGGTAPAGENRPKKILNQKNG